MLLQLDSIQGLPPSPLFPLLLYLTLYLDRDRDCHIAHLPKHRCSLLTAEEWSFQPCHAKQGSLLTVCHMPHEASAGNPAQFTSQTRRDSCQGCVKVDVWTQDYKKSPALTHCPDDLLIKSLYGSPQQGWAVPLCKPLSKFRHKKTESGSVYSWGFHAHVWFPAHIRLFLDDCWYQFWSEI